jgi:hypothetical protein
MGTLSDLSGATPEQAQGILDLAADYLHALAGAAPPTARSAARTVAQVADHLPPIPPSAAHDTTTPLLVQMRDEFGPDVIAAVTTVTDALAAQCAAPPSSGG